MTCPTKPSGSRQTSESFDNHEDAARWKALLDKVRRKRETAIYTPEQFLFHQRHAPEFWHKLMQFLIRLGPRWSEPAALMPLDSGRRRKTAHIQQAWKWTGAHETRLEPPKGNS